MISIAGFQPFSLSDYPSVISAIVFLQGCDLRCPYCHNRSLWPKTNGEIEENAFFDFLKKRKGSLEGVVVTGGEPLIQKRLLPFLKTIKSLGFNIKLDTNGNHPEVLKRCIKERCVDFIAMDIKAPFNLYSQLTGVDIDIKNIQESIDLIVNAKIKHLFRTTWDKERLTQQDIERIKKTLPPKSEWILQKYNSL